jgi:hypothetical protein
LPCGDGRKVIERLLKAHIFPLKLDIYGEKMQLWGAQIFFTSFIVASFFTELPAPDRSYHPSHY